MIEFHTVKHVSNINKNNYLSQLQIKNKGYDYMKSLLLDESSGQSLSSQNWRSASAVAIEWPFLFLKKNNKN